MSRGPFRRRELALMAFGIACYVAVIVGAFYWLWP